MSDILSRGGARGGMVSCASPLSTCITHIECASCGLEPLDLTDAAEVKLFSLFYIMSDLEEDLSEDESFPWHVIVEHDDDQDLILRYWRNLGLSDDTLWLLDDMPLLYWGNCMTCYGTGIVGTACLNCVPEGAENVLGYGVMLSPHAQTHRHVALILRENGKRISPTHFGWLIAGDTMSIERYHPRGTRFYLLARTSAARVCFDPNWQECSLVVSRRDIEILRDIQAENRAQRNEQDVERARSKYWSCPELGHEVAHFFATCHDMHALFVSKCREIVGFHDVNDPRERVVP